MREVEINDSTSINVNGKLTVTVNLKGSPRRYRQPDVVAEVHVNCGGDVYEFISILDVELAKVRRAILVACGCETVSS